MTANNKIEYEKSLEFLFPDLAKEWDFERNKSLDLASVTAGSHKKVYWKCPICKKSYLARICNRTAPSRQNTKTNKCPICLGRIIIPGYNSLIALYPDLVAKEWDYNKNTVDPDTIPPHRNSKQGKYWWICPQGHNYQSSPNNKVNGKGGNCPYCSHQKLTIENSLAIRKPDLAEEWDYESNGIKTPETFFVNSNKYANWICFKCGHKWEAKISNRSQLNRGCPNCTKGTQTSFPEQVIFHYIKEFFPDAINRYKIHKYEVDIYIPSIKVAIEYDGEYYHKSKEKIIKDYKKNKFVHKEGINLIRIRENGCFPMSEETCSIFIYKYSYDNIELTKVIEKLLNFLSVTYSITYSTPIDINIQKIANNVYADVYNISYEDSFAAYEEKQKINEHLLKAIWDTKANAPLTPKMVSPMSDKTVWWICPHNNEHKWEAPIKSISKGYGCSICAKRHHYSTEEWIKEAKRTHGDKYDYSQVNYLNAKTEVTIICKKHGAFKQYPSEHLQGKGCKYCAHQAFHQLESLASLYPNIATEWNYELNNSTGYIPENIGIDSTRKFFWHCNNGKPHSYRATIAYRVKRKSGCAVCHGKQVDYKTSVEYLLPDLASEWSNKNKFLPCEVSLGSSKKILWKCSNPDHQPYLASVYSRARLNSGCPECSGNKKSPLTYKKELQKRFSNIELISDYQKSSERVMCKCNICGYIWSPFPYNLSRSKGCPKCHNTPRNKEVI